MFSLQEDMANEKLLGWQLVNELFNEYNDGTALSEINNLIIQIDSTDINNNDTLNPNGRYQVDVTFEFPIQNQIFISSGPIPAFLNFTGPDVIDVLTSFPRVPRTVDLSFEMIVTVTIDVKRGTEIIRTITSRAVYEYSGGKFSDDDPEYIWDITEDVYDMDFTENGFGTWELMRYEVIDPDIN